jgi:hypothetical protein
MNRINRKLCSQDSLAFAAISLTCSFNNLSGRPLWFFFGKRLQFHETTLHTGSGAQVVFEGFPVNNNIRKFADKLFSAVLYGIDP